MKILIYGGKGWIGGQIIEHLIQSDIDYILGNARVDNLLELEKEIKAINPSHILSLIGRTHGKVGDKIYSTIDYLELPDKLVENIRDNLFGPIQLANICQKLDIHFTYLGTGCIFNNDEEKNISKFTEEDNPNFFGSSYSIVKGFTDQLMHLYPKTLNLRIRMPISDKINERNFITKIVNYDKICSISNSMTVLPELIPIMISMIKKKLMGTINLVNPGVISHNEILELYKEIVDKNFTWLNMSLEEQNKILLSKRSNNSLDTTKLISLYPDVKDIKTSIKNCLLNYKISLNKNINLLITGGYGFIGSNFINYIYNKYENINIINIDYLYYCSNINNVDKHIVKSSRYKFYKCNICDKKSIEHILSANNIDYIIHFAAQSHVDNSFNDSIQYTYDNILGTHTLLEACRKYGKIKKFIHFSTDEVYGESHLDDIEQKTELSNMLPTNPYAGTKAAAELIARTYYYSFNIPLIITRCNNVYGKNQYPEKVIPKFIKLLNENQKITIHGDGSSKRAFLHIDDSVKAIDKIYNYGIIGEIYNIGCDENMEYSILQLAKILIKKIKKTDNYQEWINFTEDRPFNDKRYFINNDKIKKLGWNINIKLDEGLNQLILN